MDPDPLAIHSWMQENLNNWAEQGTLSLERSAQLQMRISRLAQQERKSRFKRKLYGLATAVITFIWLLFASCPVAAAAYAGNAWQSTDSSQVTAVCLFVFLIGLFIKYQIQSLTTNINFEGNYE